MHRVYLVPGFFGFVNLGDMRYWGPVQAAMKRRLDDAGVAATVHAVPTPPTASLRARAHALLDVLATTATDADDLHLIGHSSGGLDARLLATPQVQLPDGETAEPFASRIRTVVTVATPHRGTPAAEVYASLYGKQLLRLVSLATVFAVRNGSLPLKLALRLANVLRRVAGPGSDAPDLDDQLFDALLAEFSDDRRADVARFFGDVGADQALLSQLTPSGMDLFDQTAPDRPGVRYGCVVTRARPPAVTDALFAGPTPLAQAMTALYTTSWVLASRTDPAHLPPLDAATRDALVARLGAAPAPSDNDAMVPTLSQPHGALLAAVHADHLDVIGHYPDPGADPPRYDWLSSGSEFRRPQFEATWDAVASFLLA